MFLRTKEQGNFAMRTREHGEIFVGEKEHMRPPTPPGRPLDLRQSYWCDHINIKSLANFRRKRGH